MALASLGRVGRRQAGPATSKSEDKDTWRGPGMLMANSTPTVRHVYLTAYRQKPCCTICVLLEALILLVKK